MQNKFSQELCNCSGLNISVATGSVTKFRVAGSLNCCPQILTCELGGANMSMDPWVMGHPKTVRWAGVGGAGAQDSEGQGRAPLILPPPGLPPSGFLPLAGGRLRLLSTFFIFPQLLRSAVLYLA